MSEQFQGIVRALPDKVEVALSNYTKDVESTKEILRSLKIKSETDIRPVNMFLWFNVNESVKKIIHEALANTWFITEADLYRRYYPAELSYQQVDLLNDRYKSTYLAIKRMYTHNSSEMYLTQEQASFVNRWCK